MIPRRLVNWWQERFSLFGRQQEAMILLTLRGDTRGDQSNPPFQPHPAWNDIFDITEEL
jgi:hypothetical protein